MSVSRRPAPTSVRFQQIKGAFKYPLFQASFALLLAATAYWFYSNTVTNLSRRSIGTGYEFMNKSSGFDISEASPLLLLGWPEALAGLSFLGLLIAFWQPWQRPQTQTTLSIPQRRLRFYAQLGLLLVIPAIVHGLLGTVWESRMSWIVFDPTSSYWTAFFTGAANTLRVAFLSILTATLLGVAIGTLRTLNHPFFAGIGRAYVDLIRNVPLLLQLVIWYAVVLNAFPQVKDGFQFGQSVFLNNRGLYTPMPVFGEGAYWLIVAFVAALFINRLISFERDLWQERTGRRPRVWGWQLALLLGLPALSYAVAGAPLDWEYPKLVFGGRNLRGGLNLSPEFLALYIGLSTYTAAFIAEITRAGIHSVPKGQSEAGFALGLSGSQSFFQIVLPQALRAMVPPLASQYLNLTKNSSLAIAIGYADVVSSGGIIINQEGQAIEVIGLWMGFYLFVSLSIVLIMNIYNHRIRMVERT